MGGNSQSSNKLAVGIDLGTTCTCMAIYKNGKVTTIHNEKGNYTTPSFVCFNRNERIVGEGAKRKAAVNPQDTVFEIKRLIGRRFDDDSVQKDIKKWPFKVVNVNDHPNIEVFFKNSIRTFCPEQISAMVLSKMMKEAQSFCGEEVRDAVITVPAYFTDAQRRATIDAGEIAGFNVLKIINEPTAAGIAYGFNETNKEKNILVYDLGGGTFDVAILQVSKSDISVKAVGGSTRLGGSDFDQVLVDYFVQEIKHKYRVDISLNQRALGKLRQACVTAKEELSTARHTDVTIECLYNDAEFHETLYRNKFEDLCAPLFEQTITLTERTLEDAGMSSDDIEKIVLIGGSTRIPKIQDLLKRFFHDKQLAKDIHPDQAVAHGAALQAAFMNNVEISRNLGDVNPFSIRVAIVDDNTVIGIEKNTELPCKGELTLTTSYDYQNFVKFRIFEGESKKCEHNTLLGTFTLDNIEQGLCGAPTFHLTLAIDTNGVLSVTVEDEDTGSNNKLIIESTRGGLNETQKKNMIAIEQEMSENS